jgi:hypothetical protein
MGHLSRISLREILTRSQFLEKRNPEKSFSESSRIQLRYLTICRHKRMNAASKFADQDIYNRLGRQITKTAHSANQTKQIRRPQKTKPSPKTKKGNARICLFVPIVIPTHPLEFGLATKPEFKCTSDFLALSDAVCRIRFH